MIGRGALRRCPLCGGRGAWFRQWGRKDDRCHTCGFAWNRNTDGFMTGSMTINMIITFGLIFGVLVVMTVITYPELPVAPLVAVLLGIAVVGAARDPSDLVHAVAGDRPRHASAVGGRTRGRRCARTRRRPSSALRADLTQFLAFGP